MYRQKAKSGYRLIDDKMIRVDSQMEGDIIELLVARGFAGKWRRMRRGIAFGWHRYTPDVELCVLHDSMNRRALVEFKAFSATEFTADRRRAMLAVSRFYGDAICLLYVFSSKRWYIIEPGGGLSPTSQPTPGGVLIDELPKPRLMIPVWSRYGRSYLTRPNTLLLKKTADGLEFIVKSFVYSPRHRKGKQQK